MSALPRALACVLLLLLPGCAPAAPQGTVRAAPARPAAAVPPSAAEIVPLVDHHKHVMSAGAAALIDRQAFTADQLVAELDSAGVRRAVVLSVAYWYGRPGRVPPVEDERGKTRAENDHTVREAARYPDRLIPFCSVNPLSDYALDEIERCARVLRVTGLKLHLGNSRVDLRDSAQVAKVAAVFRAANARRLAIVSHNWTVDPRYGAEDAQIFLDRLLPEAPDVVVQIAHFAGGGPGYTDTALGVFADAITRDDPRTKRLYFDVATVADRQPVMRRHVFATRVRQIGIDRVLWGSDLSVPGSNPTAKDGWENFRTTVPLTGEELRRIATNVAPYLR